MLDQKFTPAIKTLWDFNKLNQTLEKSDLMVVLGSNDLNVPVRASQVYKSGLVDKIITSGGFGRLTKDLTKAEAEVFADIMIENKIPENLIYIENKSTNTGENIQFSYDLAIKNHLKMDKIIVVTTPYMERRALATFKKQWPGKNSYVKITSPLQTFEDLLADLDIISSVNIMVGDTQRLKVYPKMGFMEETEIPDSIWQAFEFLASNGFDKELIK